MSNENLMLLLLIVLWIVTRSERKRN